MSVETVLEIHGGQPLNGAVAISGAKNAILPLMAATVLTDKPVVFSNVPQISDVVSMKKLLASHGVSVDFDQNRITATNPRPIPDDPTISGKFRASVLLLGPLLARLGRARVYDYGGDDIDSQGRPVDIHVTNLRSLGATVNEIYKTEPPYTLDYIEASAPPSGLRAPNRPLVLAKVSVGGTQNTIMAACVARGTTTIEKASIEPETLDLIKLLKSMGAEIEVNKAERKIKVKGKDIATFNRRTISHTVIPDRIVAGTYAIAAVITGGTIELQIGNVPNEAILELLEAEFWRLLAAGVDITRTQHGVIRVSRKRIPSTGQLVPIKPVSVMTKPYPGFPTDLHPQWAALMCFSNGQSWIDETVFDQRFNYVEQLQEMGAVIDHPLDSRRVNVVGNQDLTRSRQPPVAVQAGDIRAGAALILAAHARNGITYIRGFKKHVERGYEDFVNKFTSCGFQMKEGEMFFES